MSRLVATSRRIEFVILRTASSLPVALHPASRRRSYLQLRGLGLPRHGLTPCCLRAFTGARYRLSPVWRSARCPPADSQLMQVWLSLMGNQDSQNPSPSPGDW